MKDTNTAPSNKSADPIALTFFLTPIQRRCVLRKLKELGPDRAASLLASLSLTHLNQDAISLKSNEARA